jgi:hypothetical protein
MRLRGIVPIVLTAAVVAALLFFVRDEIAISRISAQLAAANAGYLAFSALFFLVGYAGAVIRNKFILDRATGSNVSFKYLFLLSNFSFVSGFVLPVSVAAEVVRIAFIKRYVGVTYSRSVRVVLLDKILGFAGIAFFALVFIPAQLLLGINRTLIALEGLSIAVCLLLLPVAVKGSSWMLRRVPALGSLSTALANDWRFVVDNFSSRRDLMTFFMSALLATFGFVIGTVLIAHAIGLDTTAVIFFTAPMILLVQNIPLFYGGFGAREATLLIALQNVPNTDTNQILGFSLLIGAMLFVSAVPAALVFIFRALPPSPHGPT